MDVRDTRAQQVPAGPCPIPNCHHWSAAPTRRMAHGTVKEAGGGGCWHKALVVGSVSLWRRYWPLAFEPSAKQESVLLRASALPRASTGLGGNPECNFSPWRPPLTA